MKGDQTFDDIDKQNKHENKETSESFESKQYLPQILILWKFVQLRKHYLYEDNTPVEIIPRLFLGTIGSAYNIEILRNQQITHILCAAKHIKAKFPSEFVYLNLDMTDNNDCDIFLYLKLSYDFIDQSLLSNGSCLVHCFAGKSRSVSLVCYYLMQKYHLGFDAAFEMIRTKRTVVSPNLSFLHQLKQIESQHSASY